MSVVQFTHPHIHASRRTKGVWVPEYQLVDDLVAPLLSVVGKGVTVAGLTRALRVDP
jgi:hypothetical protein